MARSSRAPQRAVTAAPQRRPVPIMPCLRGAVPPVSPQRTSRAHAEEASPCPSSPSTSDASAPSTDAPTSTPMPTHRPPRIRRAARRLRRARPDDAGDRRRASGDVDAASPPGVLHGLDEPDSSRRAPSASCAPTPAASRQVGFRRYVAEVMASGEWPGRLHTTTLEAGAVATKQYAWYYALKGHHRSGYSPQRALLRRPRRHDRTSSTDRSARGPRSASCGPSLPPGT